MFCVQFSLRERLKQSAAAHQRLDHAIQSRQLSELVAALAAVEAVGLDLESEGEGGGEGFGGEEGGGGGDEGHGSGAGLLHTARLLVSRMESEQRVRELLLSAVAKADDAVKLRQALDEASAMGLRGPEIAAAQTVLLELVALHKLRVAAETHVRTNCSDPRHLLIYFTLTLT